MTRGKQYLERTVVIDGRTGTVTKVRQTEPPKTRKGRHDPTRWQFEVTFEDGTTVWKDKYELGLGKK